MRTLRQGSQGPDVARVQQFLASWRDYAGECDGHFGPLTADAVQRYQQRHNLVADGVIGHQTLAAMLQENLNLLVDRAEDDFPPVPDFLKPLRTNEERMRRWGRFEYEPAPEKDNPEAIRILGDWEDEHIASFQCPVFQKTVRLHKDVMEDYILFMEAVRAKGLAALLLTHEGGHSARFMRGSRKSLSSHAWGSAFDVNAAWNGLGAVPAYRGRKGSVRELVPLANRFNFYWGGHFRTRPDGMHFEHC